MEKVLPPPTDGYAACPLEKAWRCIFDSECKGSIQEERVLKGWLEEGYAEISLSTPPVTNPVARNDAS